MAARARALVAGACERERGREELEREYQAIGQHSPYRETAWGTSSHEAMLRDGKCQIANAAHNLALNRFSNILPFDAGLVKCSKGFVNASAVTPVARPCLIAQGPMEAPDTREAFWHMVMDNDVRLMVNLAPLGPECADYLSGPRYGSAIVEVASEQQILEHTVLREIRVASAGGEPRLVTHVQFDDWPNYSTPAEPVELAAVLALVLRLRREGCATQTLVNCSGGVGRSGTFVATMAVWEHLQLLAEQEAFDANGADEFGPQLVAITREAIESVRNQRHPWLVEGVGQYHLIFQLLRVLAKGEEVA